MDEGEQGRIKGGVFVSRLAFLREQGGEPLVERVLSALPPVDQEALRGIVLSSAWYPFEINERLDLAIGAAMGRGDQLFRELGHRSALHNLGTAHRNYIRDHDPHSFLRRTASIYRVYYDTGSRTFEETGPTAAILRTIGSKSFSRTDCLTVVGWYETAIEMCGAANARVTETKCRARGDDVCEYLCEWQ